MRPEANGSSLPNCVGTFHFQFRLSLIKLYIFVQRKACSLTLKRHNSFQIKNNKKATYSFGFRPLIFKLQQEV